MPGLTDWFDVFRCGTHTDRFGREVTVTPADIDAAIAGYQADTAPIVVGHPTLNAPAYGWIKAFRRVGDTVQAKASSVAAEFADVVKRHLYKNRSLAFGPGLKFRHVGFLGAQAPAVKGLQDIQFAIKEDYMDVEFSEPTPAEMPADADVKKPDAPPAPNEPAKEQMPEEKSVSAELAEVKSELAKSKAATKKLEELVAKLTADYDTAKRDLRQGEFAAYADDLVASGRLSKDRRSQLMEFMECLHGMDSYQFSEGEMPVLQRFKDLFGAVAQHPVQMAEFASPDKAAPVPITDSAELGRLARAFIDAEAKAGRSVSATAAVEHVMKG